MKVSAQFLKARKAKGLTALIVKREISDATGTVRDYMYLCIDEKSVLTDDVRGIYIETDTEININNFRNGIDKAKLRVCFNIPIWNNTGLTDHAQTFLNAIKKDSEVSFYVVAYNGNDYWDANNMVSHQLYGVIDGKKYLLDFFTGAENSASPVLAYSLFPH